MSNLDLKIMKRHHFLRAIALLPLAAWANKNKNLMMELNDLDRLQQNLPDTPRMPVLFVGHGSPMNAILENNYSRTWAGLGKKLPHPQAVLCISAHWLTNGSSVSVTAKPETIHDFGGFPDELFKVQYPAPGSPQFAKLTAQSVSSTKILEDNKWGLDHGAWSVLKHMYPSAEVPIFQLSIDYNKPAAYHFELGKQLSALREKGVLIIGSGNVVHNLGMISWNEPTKSFDWALEFDHLVKKSIEENNPKPLLEFEKLGKLAQMAHPTADHFFPLMYILGLRRNEDQLSFFNETFDMGSISMRGVLFTGA